MIIGLIIIEAFTLTLTYKSYGNKILDNVKEEYEVDKNKFSMYVETKDNEGNISYEEYNESGIFPTGYKINLEKSNCTDTKGNVINGILSGRGNKVTITSNKTAYCYIYFDIDYKLSDLCTSGDNLGSCLTSNNEHTMSRYHFDDTNDECQSWYVTSAGNVYYAVLSGINSVRPVFYLKSTVNFIGGTGTASDPFLIS